MTSKSVLADTHTFVWWLFEPDKLSLKAKQALKQAEDAGDHILVSVITIIELCYLTEKGKLPEDYLLKSIEMLEDSTTAPMAIALDMDGAKALREISRDVVPDMPDRIIAATALSNGVPLITRDGRIRQLTNIKIIW